MSQNPPTFGNKYQEEARLLAQGLEGTKWSAVVGDAPPHARQRGADLLRYTRAKPLTALMYAVATGFIFGALRSVVRR